MNPRREAPGSGCSWWSELHSPQPGSHTLLSRCSSSFTPLLPLFLPDERSRSVAEISVLPICSSFSSRPLFLNSPPARRRWGTVGREEKKKKFHYWCKLSAAAALASYWTAASSNPVPQKLSLRASQAESDSSSSRRKWR